MLKERFFALASRYNAGQEAIQRFWDEIEQAYTAPDRHFHNLRHVEDMFAALDPLKENVADWDSLQFSVFYHDLVYDVMDYVTNNDNEERSAERAAAALPELGYPANGVERCRRQILATKYHKPSDDEDTNLLTDADLAVLAQPWPDYHRYMKAIRKEFEIFPDPVYHAGRLKVLRQFLNTPRLFKTTAFSGGEETARENMCREIEILSLS